MSEAPKKVSEKKHGTKDCFKCAKMSDTGDRTVNCTLGNEQQNATIGRQRLAFVSSFISQFGIKFDRPHYWDVI